MTTSQLTCQAIQEISVVLLDLGTLIQPGLVEVLPRRDSDRPDERLELPPEESIATYEGITAEKLEGERAIQVA